MPGLRYEELARYLDEAVGRGDPDDPRERKRLQIVRAATELFVRQGYRKTSMAEVADQHRGHDERDGELQGEHTHVGQDIDVGLAKHDDWLPPTPAPARPGT